MRLIQIFLADLKELLAEREFVSLRTALRRISPMDLADGWEHFTTDERMVLFRLAPRQRALQLFEELESEHQEELIMALREEDLEDLVEDLDPSETGRIMRELPPPLVRQLETILKRTEGGEEVEKYLQYPEDTVGEIMRSNYVSLNAAWTCKRALERIQMRTLLKLVETTFLDELFLVDADGTLRGMVRLKELVVAPSDMVVSELMNKDPEVLRPEMDQEEAAQLFAHYKLESAPVIDENRQLLGVVLDQDIVDVVEEETEEDFAMMAGTAPESFEAQSAWESVRHRMPWLTVTCLGQLMVAGIIRGFENTLSQMVAIATFMPFIAAMGGNVGTQSAIIAVRELSTGELDKGAGSRVLLRDLKVGFLLGACTSVVLVMVSHLLYGARFGWTFSLVSGSGVLVSMTIAAMLGGFVPLLFNKVGVDPAVATGPFVSTLTDMIATASYLGLATYILFF